MKKSLSSKLALGGILVGLIPMVVVGLISASKSSTALQETSQIHSVQTAKSLAGMVQLVLLEEIKLITNLSIQKSAVEAASKVSKEGLGIAEAEVEELSRELVFLKNKVGQDYESLFVTDASGIIFADSAGGKIKGTSMADRQYFKEAKKGKISIGSVVKSKFTGKPVVPLAAPIYSKTGEFVGTAVFGLKSEFFTNRVTSIKFGNSGYAFLANRAGLVIAHPKEEYILELDLRKQDGMKEILEKMAAQQTGAQTYIFQGMKKLAGFAPVDLTGWSVVVTQNFNDIMSPAYAIRNAIMIIGGVSLAITILAVLYFSRSISRPIARTARKMNGAADQVASASAQVSSASQSLAEGTTEQASGIEETSSSIEEMASMTKQNAENAHQSKVMMAEANQIVEKVDKHMGQMAQAILEVTRSSEETGKIIKTIDEIAFQTNLLALNAAVEAARAGEAGAGFAVVADEVRNLAMRASEAAKNTNNLIENTIKAVKNGNALTQATQEAFKENMAISSKISKLIDEIAAASQEQAQGVNQINRAVAELDKVVQSNAANAEESAAAAEEMSAQGQQMKAFVVELMAVIEGSKGGDGTGTERGSRQAGPESGIDLPPGGKSGIGKLFSPPTKRAKANGRITAALR